MDQKFGHVIARGDATFIALVKDALDECKNLPEPLQDIIAADYVIESKSPLEMVNSGAIIPGSKNAHWPKGKPAEGHVMAHNVLYVNEKIARTKPARARHIVRHELFHVVLLTDAKRAELMALMLDEAGKHPTNWRGGAYQGRPSECYADTMAEAASSLDSPWDDFAYFSLDVAETSYARFIEITLRLPTPVDPPPTVDPGTPPPLPPEPDYVTALRLTLQDRDERLAIIHEKSAV